MEPCQLEPIYTLFGTCRYRPLLDNWNLSTTWTRTLLSPRIIQLSGPGPYPWNLALPGTELDNWMTLCTFPKLLRIPKAQSTYVCRVQSSVWRLPKYWPPTSLFTQRVCPPPHHQMRGGTHSPGGEGIGGHRHWIGLLQYLSTLKLRTQPYMAVFYMAHRTQKELYNKQPMLPDLTTGAS